jgi:endonuclease/exonuclease/phosphatase family metal-dependent hydrolase
VRDDLNWPAIENTGRVVDAVRADVLLTVEVEDRLSLERFNRHVLGETFPGAAYPYNLLVDGNDTRGIDIGLYSRQPILGVRSYSHVENDGSRVFSRDCPEFDVDLGAGRTLVVLGNHFKSKGYGDPAYTAARRLQQAIEVKKIYDQALARSPFVVVAGDLNDTPDSAPLTTLTTSTGLRDVMEHPTYVSGPDPRPGTYKSGNPKSSKIDYILLSPQLWNVVTAVGVERRGIWAPQSIVPVPGVTSTINQASDHGAVWADLNV